jgi:hypothetical protein
MEDGFEFFADPLAHGRITPRALLATTGTIIVPLVPEFLLHKSHLPIARLAGAGWFFNVGYTAGTLVIQRNGGSLAIDAKWCQSRSLPETVLVSWTLESLILAFGTHATHQNYPQLIESCHFTVPPPELVRWVRNTELSSVTLFSNEEEFLLRVHSSFQRFEERLSPILNNDIFWDVTRSGSRVVERRPKRETDVQSAMHAMLIDHMQLSNIDVLPEVRSPAGAVDFVLSSPLRNGTTAKICVEFKNAHSRNLISGLRRQLRSYMNRLEVRNGAYCVLDYRNGNFQQPSLSTMRLLAALHEEDEPTAKWPNRPVKIHWITLANTRSEARQN